MENVHKLKEVLQFIKDCQFIETRELSNEFGYTIGFAVNKMVRLHKAGLVDNAIHGKWSLSVNGLRRLEYYNGH
jgi:hypothetical protein